MRYHYYERWKVVLLVCVLAFAFCAAAAGGAFLWWQHSYRFSIPADEIGRVAIFSAGCLEREAGELTDLESVAALCEAVNALRIRRVPDPDRYFVDGGTSYLLVFHKTVGRALYLSVNPAGLMKLRDTYAGAGEGYLYAETAPDMARAFFEQAQPLPVPVPRLDEYIAQYGLP